MLLIYFYDKTREYYQTAMNSVYDGLRNVFIFTLHIFRWCNFISVPSSPPLSARAKFSNWNQMYVQNEFCDSGNLVFDMHIFFLTLAPLFSVPQFSTRGETDATIEFWCFEYPTFSTLMLFLYFFELIKTSIITVPFRIIEILKYTILNIW